MRRDVLPTVVFAGDSITASGDWRAWLPDMRIINLAIPGHSTADLRARIPEIEQCRPDAVSILIGTNDFGGLDRRPADVAADIARIIGELASALPARRILVQSIMPRAPIWTDRILAANSAVRSAAYRLGIGYLDTWPALALEDRSGLNPAYLLDDGFDVHLNAHGYEAWLTVLEPAIRARL